MSTRSRIAIEEDDGSIRSIYCHFDGYPEGVGAILKKHYTDPQKIEELLELGDLSILGTFYDQKLAEMEWKRWGLSEEEQKKLDALTKGMTIPYKDRGESAPARVDKDLREFTSKLGNCGEEYTYLFAPDYSGVYHWEFAETPYFKAF